jgi:tetratricopeptide (TPR) repeat protein
MKIITKEIPIDELILNVKTNYKNSEKYFLLSTKEVYPHLERWLNQYCPNLKSVTLNCFIEKVPKEFSHPLIMIEIDEKFVKKEELEKFTQMEKELFQIILAPNNIEYDNDDDFRWFIRKIFDIDQNDKNFVPKNEDTDFYVDKEILGSSSIKFNVIIRKCAASFYEKGNDLHNKGKYVDSLNFFNIAKILDKTYFTLHSLALTYFKIQNYSKCIKFADESLKLNNKFVPSQILLSHCFFNEGNFDRALKEIENVDRDNLRKRDILDIELQLAKIHMILGHNEKSLNHFENTVQITPEKFRSAIINQILFFKYTFHKEVNDYEQCCNILEVLIKRRPEHSPYFALLGLTKLILKKYAESEKYLLASLNIDKENEYTILPYLAVSYLEQNKYSNALKTFKKCVLLKNKISSNTYSIILEVIETIPKLIEKEEKMQKTMGLNDVLDQINSKNIDVESTQNDYGQIISKLTKQSKNTIAIIEEFPTVSYEQLRKTDLECLAIMREFIRKKYSGNINLLKDDPDLFTHGFGNNGQYDNYVYKNIEKNMKNREDTIWEQKPIDDLFDCLDFGNFPFLIRKKYRSWEIPKDTTELLQTITSSRNTPAHHSGPDELGNLNPLDSNLHYFACRKIIILFENKMKI